MTTQDGQADVFLARSTDGGATFEAPVVVENGPVAPIVGMARHPYVTADDARVAVGFNDDVGIARVYVADAGGELSFGEPQVVGTDVPSDFRDFTKPLFLNDGSLVVAFHAYPASGARVFVTRESANWSSEAATSGAPGVPCECCPIELVNTDAGDIQLAFRNNEGNQREMWMARAPGAGAFSTWTDISTTEGMIDACPMQGPRLAQVGPANHLAVWSQRGDAAGPVALATSSDGGASWSGGAPIPGLVGDEPTIAVGASGRIYVTAVTGTGKSIVVWSDDDGASWSSPEPLQVPDGDIGTPQAEGANGLAALAGVSSAGTVWLRRME